MRKITEIADFSGISDYNLLKLTWWFFKSNGAFSKSYTEKDESR
jgi:hypothetical protein